MLIRKIQPLTYITTTLFFGALIFIIWQIGNVILVHKAVIKSDLSLETVKSNMLTIEGTANKIKLIKINGNNVPVSTSGTWSNSILLPDGYSVVTIESDDAYGHKNIEGHPIFVAKDPPPQTVGSRDTLPNTN